MAALAFVADHIEHRGPRRLIPRGGDHAEWLVQDDVPVSGDGLDRLAVDGDPIVVGVDENSLRGRRLAVDTDSSRGDQLIGCAAARDAGSRQEAIQPFFVSDRVPTG